MGRMIVNVIDSHVLYVSSFSSKENQSHLKLKHNEDKVSATPGRLKQEIFGILPSNAIPS